MIMPAIYDPKNAISIFFLLSYKFSMCSTDSSQVNMDRSYLFLWTHTGTLIDSFQTFFICLLPLIMDHYLAWTVMYTLYSQSVQE